MVGDAGVDEQRLRLLCATMSSRFGEEAWSSWNCCSYLAAKCCVGLDDGDELDVGMLLESAEEAADVAVLEADDGDADGCRDCACACSDNAEGR